MNPQPQSIYQRVIDRTKSIGFQTQFLAQCIEKVKGSNSGRARGHFETNEGRASVSHLILHLLHEIVIASAYCSNSASITSEERLKPLQKLIRLSNSLRIGNN